MRLRELNAAAISAGLTAFIWYACGALPLQLAVAGELAFSSGSVFIVWVSGAAASILLSWRLRQPIPITWSIPALVYLGSLAGRFSAADLAGGVLMSACVLAVLVLAGGGSRLMKWLPMPIVMATFGGSRQAALRRPGGLGRRCDALQHLRNHFRLLGPGSRSSRFARRQGTRVACSRESQSRRPSWHANRDTNAALTRRSWAATPRTRFPTGRTSPPPTATPKAPAFVRRSTC